MKPENFNSFNKENSNYLDELIEIYEQDKKMFEESLFPEMIIKLFIDEEKDFDFKTTKPFRKEEKQTKYPSKYLAEFIWDKKETINGDTFCKTFMVIPETKRKRIIISASEEVEIKRERFKDRDFIKKILSRVFENPIQRSNSPFYETEKIFSSSNAVRK
jgi:hypothetical protein